MVRALHSVERLRTLVFRHYRRRPGLLLGGSVDDRVAIVDI